MTHKIVARGWLAAALVLPAVPTAYRYANGHQAAESYSTPRFKLSADTVLMDEVAGIAVTGLPPGHDVTIRLNGLEWAKGWYGSATFRADGNGNVDLTRDAPIAGRYVGVHAMGIFWSAMKDSSAKPLVSTFERTPEPQTPLLQPWELVAEVGGQAVATDTVWRLLVARGVSITPVRERGIVGTLYLPPGSGRHPAVIVLNGSQGGIAPPNGVPGGLASRGYVVLALGYFATEGLPPRLVNIPLEYFGGALQWLAEQPSVDSTRIGVVGQSRGGELALLLGAHYPAIRAVVAYVPSNVAWPGTLADSTRAPAWTYRGSPVPGIYHHESPGAVARHAGCPLAPTCQAPLTRHEFLALLDDSAAAARAEIPVERINGPVFLISGEDDGLWPSTLMAERVVQRLRQHGFRYPVEHAAYPAAGHGIGRPYVPTPDVAVARPHQITGRMITPGGTPAGTALASEDSWSCLLKFLDASFRENR